jgi:hypothetical protein
MKKNKLTMGVVAGLAGIAGIANADQHINPEGTGEVLIYPYYTVKNGLDTNYSVVNTTADTKAIKVRFLEGENTIEVLDFNVYLSAYDVWTGVLTAVTDGDGNVVNGEHRTGDRSCAPYLPKASQEFLPFAMLTTDPNAVAAGNVGMNRATEGHFEILEMATFANGTYAYFASDHTNTGTPNDCQYFVDQWNTAGVNAPFPDAGDEGLTTGGLFGSASMVNVNEGVAMTYDAIAIDDFWEGGVGVHSAPGNLAPSIASGDDDILIFDQGVIASLNYPTGAEAVSGLFQRAEIYNEYALDSAVAGKTEWVVTFPTKNPHVNNPIAVIPPFVNPWTGTESCHEFSMLLWDREEQEEQPDDGTISPQPPAGTNPTLCYEANVVRFLRPGADTTTKTILGSDNLTTVRTPQVAHATENGWARISFAAYSDANGYVGLPVAGFAAQQFTNAGAGDGLLAQYAGLFVHKGMILSN